MRSVLLVCALWVGDACAQPPAIAQNGVVNAASQIPGSLPGGGIARGALFTIYGVRLGGGQGDVQIAIHTAAGEVRAVVVRAAPRTILARMPVDAPPGPASLTVGSAGESSRPFPIAIVTAAPGLYTRNGAGWGPAAMEPAGAVRPGQRIQLQATGAGSGALTANVGGHTARAAIVRRGDGGRPDLVAFTVPAAAPAGCAVPVSIRTAGGLPSNTVTIAIRAGDGPCRPDREFPVAPLAGRNLGLVLAWRTVFSGLRDTDFITDEAVAQFLTRSDAGPALHPLLPPPPTGTCIAYTGSSQTGLAPTMLLRQILLGGIAGEGLRGPAVLRAGSIEIPALPGSPGAYEARLGGESLQAGGRPLPLFFGAPPYTIGAPAAASFGPFTLAMPAIRPLTWKNWKSAAAIDRARGFTVEWTGAAAGPVAVLAVSVDEQAVTGAMAYCVASGAAGRFTIPPSAMAHFPVSRALSQIPRSSVSLITAGPGQVSPAPVRGLDALLGLSVFAHAARAVFH